MNTHRDVFLALALVLAVAAPAWAYVGPGAGLTAIGAALAFIAGIVLAIIGFIWYPIKRLLRARPWRAKASKSPVDNLTA